MNYKTYSNYKHSNVDWMGEIPTNWNIQKLKFLSQNLDNKRIPISAGDRKEGTVPYYGATGIVDHVEDYIFNEDLLLVGEDGAPFFDKDKNVSFLISGKTWVNNHAHVLKIDQSLILDKLVMHSLNCTDYSLYIKGSTRDKLNQEQLKDIPIIVPPFEEQQYIVDYLDKKENIINEIIIQNEKLISLIEEKRVALINQAVTKGLDYNVPMKNSTIKWIDKIPEHWDIHKIKNLIFFQEGPGLRNWQFTDNGIRVICVTNITERGIDFSKYEKFISEDEYHQMYNHFTVNKGDLLLSSSGNSWGKVAEYVSDETVILNTSTIRINKNRSSDYELNQPFIKWLLQSDYVREQLGLMMTGSCQPNFGPTHLAKVLIALPTPSEQKLIANYLDKEISNINNTIDVIKENIALLEEYKRSLIYHVITGKIDIRSENI